MRRSFCAAARRGIDPARMSPRGCVRCRASPASRRACKGGWRLGSLGLDTGDFGLEDPPRLPAHLNRQNVRRARTWAAMRGSGALRPVQKELIEELAGAFCASRNGKTRELGLVNPIPAAPGAGVCLLAAPCCSRGCWLDKLRHVNRCFPLLLLPTFASAHIRRSLRRAHSRTIPTFHLVP